MFRNTLFKGALFLMLGLGAVATTQAQNLTLPQGSARAELKQTVGLTDITINYGRPSVNGREGEIWGKLVPYGLQQINFASKGEVPWRAGANENTTITFSKDVTVEGEALAAGSYGLHMILKEDQSVTVIFSHNTTSWGSFWYDEGEDALRVEVTAEEGPYTELLTYDWLSIQNGEATLALSWENLRIPIKMDVNLPETTLASIREELRGLAGFTAVGLLQAANWCLQQDVNHEEAIVWANASAAQQATFNAYAILGFLYTQNGQTEEGLEALNQSAELANAGQLNFLANRMLATYPEEAVKLLEQNAKANPDNATYHNSLAQGYLAVGKEKAAIKSFRKVLSLDPPAPLRASVEQGLKDLGQDVG